MITRTPGKRGKLPVKPEGERLPIRYLHEYLSEPLPAPSYPVDVTGGIAKESWGMAGNGPDPTCTTYPDGVGDCGYAGREHYQMSKAACRGLSETPESSDDLVAEYLKYDHGQDVGVNLADVLLAWYRSGKVLAFAPVDHTNAKACDSAMQQFKGLYVGVDLTDDADQLFGESQAWTVANGQESDPDDGHCILKVKADGQGTDGYITWGAEQDATTAWTKACLSEAWAVVMHEDEIDAQALAALRADIDALHGTGGQPAGGDSTDEPPAVSRERALLGELAEHIRIVAASVDRDISEVVAFLASHGL